MIKHNWFKNAIIYHILIDRFAGYSSINNWDKPVFIGGNLKGIISKISYLKKLGVNTIWISPFYKTNVYHGYHITDFFSVDSRFGDINDLKDLINIIHENDMRIIADFVPNHCSNLHPFFIDAKNNRNSEYRKWFFLKLLSNDYKCFLSITDLPKINLDYLPARKHIINAAKFWLSLGIDGYRLDHVIGPSHNFWKVFNYEIKKEYPNCILIGEAWMYGIKFNELNTINSKWKYIKWFNRDSYYSLYKEYVNILDGVLDFKVQELFRRFFCNNSNVDSLKLLEKLIKKHYSLFPDDFFLPTFLDNHDMNRFLFECNNDKNKLKLAAEFQFSLKQIPIIYYGTEIGISQNKSIWDFYENGDLQVRKPMIWDNQDKDLLCFYINIIRDRKMKVD